MDSYMFFLGTILAIEKDKQLGDFTTPSSMTSYLLS